MCLPCLLGLTFGGAAYAYGYNVVMILLIALLVYYLVKRYTKCTLCK